MRSILCTAALACCLLLSGCNVNEMSSLRDLSRPYAGELKCAKLQLGNEDFLSEFEFVKLKLGYFGDFRLFYKTALGEEGEYTGAYRVKEDETIEFSVNSGGEEKKFFFPYRNGTVTVALPMGEKLLLAEFSLVD